MAVFMLFLLVVIAAWCALLSGLMDLMVWFLIVLAACVGMGLYLGAALQRWLRDR